MKKIIGLFLIGCSMYVAHAQKKSNTKNDGLTYAEISIKKGGSWEDGKRGHKEYVGGVFENVQELQLDPRHTDHTYFIRYEGPGWENQNVAFRLYLDWRNAVDIYGKRVKNAVLPEVGQDGFDSYHNDSPWGLDLLKAGKGLGIGGYGRLVNDTVAKFRQVDDTFVKIKNGKKSSGFEIQYKGWKTGDHKTDLTTNVTIYPYDRFSKFELQTQKLTEGLTTGIVKFKDIPLKEKKSQNGEWGYIATYGTQSLFSKTDLLGMAIFYKTSEIEKTVEAKHDHLIVFKPTTKKVTYYILAAWEQETNGITNEAEFYNDLDNKLILLEKKHRLNN